MGFLAAIGDGLASGMEQGVKDIEQESRFKQAMQMFKERMEMESKQKLADEETMHGRNQARLDEQNKKITARAGELAGQRTAGDVANLDATAAEYGSLRDKGKMTPEQYEAAMGGIQGGKGLLSAPSVRDRLMAQSEVTGKGLENIAQLDAAEENHKATRLERENDREARAAQHKESLEETRRYHNILAGDKADRRAAASALEKLPEATRLQVSSALRTVEKLEGRYYSLKPADFDSPEAYKAERDGLRSQIDALNQKAESLLGGKGTAEPPKKDLFPPKDTSKLSSDPEYGKGIKTKGVAIEEYSPDNDLQYKHVLSNLSSPAMRATAESWLEGNNLTAQKKQEVKRALGVK